MRPVRLGWSRRRQGAARREAVGQGMQGRGWASGMEHGLGWVKCKAEKGYEPTADSREER
jgi:hypothetical protein